MTFAAVNASVPASHDFGQVAVNPATPATYTLSSSFTGLSASPKFLLVYGIDFGIGAPNCSGSGAISCSLQITFVPRSTGLRLDALLITDQNGNSLATVFLYGIGDGAQATLYPGTLSTFAGTGLLGYYGNGGAATQAKLFNPTGLAMDQLGNIYIADTLNQVVRKVSASNGVITTVAGDGAPGFWGDGGPATQAMLQNPTGVAIDGAGNLYIADQGNNRIRRVTPSGTITTAAGGGATQSQSDKLGDGGPATSAILYGPNDVAVDSTGNLYIADSYNGLVREVNAVTGIITVVAGGGSGGNSDGLGDGGPASGALLEDPCGLALDANGNVYIADSGHSLVREVNASSGIISVVAGNGTYGYSGDLGPATSATLGNPVAVRTDAAGNIYIADAAINFIRIVQASSGIISTLTGSSTGGAALANPGGLVLDSKGDIYISSTPNDTIVEMTPTPQAISFGTVNIGLASQPFLLTALNVGDEPLTFSALGLTVGFTQTASGFTDCSASSTVAAGGSCFLSIEYVPTTTGTSAGTLAITNNSISASSETVSLNGAGANGPAPKLVLNPTAVSFGNVPVGSVGPAQTVSLSNAGSAALAISFITLSGTNASDFSIASSCGTTLAVNASCSVSLVFSPVASGARTAVLSFSDSVASSPQTVSLSGTGVLSSSASAAPGTVNFGNQVVGKASAAQTVKLTNTGSTSLIAPTVALTGSNAGDFKIVNSCQAALATTASCSVSITFAPSAIGSRTAVLSFSDSASNSPQGVTLSGWGTNAPQISLSPSSLDFGGVAMGGQVTQPITLLNSTSAAVQISSMTLSGSNADQFAITQNSCGVALAAKQNCTITLRFSPLLAGSMSASLNISGGSGNNLATASLAGTGARPFVLYNANTAVEAVFRPWDANWWINSGALGGTQWGAGGDIPAPADFDGDHRSDLTVFRPSTGTWLIAMTSNPGAYVSQQWGQSGDVPVPGDYDGDGKGDLAVWRPSNGTWLIKPSTNPSAFISESWGSTGDIPVPADYDGDGKADIAVWEPSSGMWWVLPSSAPGTTTSQYLGEAGDIPVPADYDGDGKTDFAVWRPSSGDWLIIPSSRPDTIITEQLGLPGDIPVPGEYHGEGKAEIAVWRAYSGYLFLSGLSPSGMRGVSTQWLLAGEIP